MIEYAFSALVFMALYQQLFPPKMNIPSATQPSITAGSPQIITHQAVHRASNLQVVSVSVQTTTGNETPISDSMQAIKRSLATVQFNDLCSCSWQYCKDNKFCIAAITAAGSYGYLYYKVRAIQSYVDNATIWSAWKQSTPFEKLLALPQDQLMHELMTTIQERYMNAENPTDFLTPLMTFAKDIENEIALLASYHSYISWSMQFSLQKIVPIADMLLSQLTEKKQRAIYINTLFQSWLAQYKLEQITKKI